jgi:hypothetical protein
MKPEESEAVLRKRVGKPVEQLTPREAIAAMCDFYADERADGADLDEDGDMLLYQWGIYSFGKPEAFQIDITRQFMVADEDEPYQLHWTCFFKPTDALRKINSSNQWCSSPDELPQFRKFVEASDAFKAVGDSKPDRVEVGFGQV